MRYFIKTREELTREFGLDFLNGESFTPDNLIWCDEPMNDLCGLEIDKDSYNLLRANQVEAHGTQVSNLKFINLSIIESHAISSKAREYFIDIHCVIIREEGLEGLSKEQITKYKNQLGGFIDEILCED